ncbi:hypothetical protein K2173_020712 [Erythroxylum novogranatense]|uniref:Cytochrome P450 n=1 Tax=Erythroxylum novogranatense TaxID=1862640 RepID=A0AAV8TLJ6_9ROSI|nr:hypothetical protein K2173_020712 [Erythroxylum novogranatense]
MEYFYLTLLLLCVPVISIFLYLIFDKHRSQHSHANLPPGKPGLPYVGESLEFLSTGWKGQPEKFVFDRIYKYSSEVFKTNIFGQPTMVVCGATAHKFLFSNENRLVVSWWPDSLTGPHHKIFPSSLQTSSKEEAIKMRKMLPEFLKPEALQRYIGVMDDIARKHFVSEWENNYTFRLACRLFISLEDPNRISKLYDYFYPLASGIISVPIDLPGTPFRRAINASKFIRNELLAIIKRRKMDLREGKATATQDILPHMLTASFEDGKCMSERDVADKILGLLIGGHDTTSAACTFIVKSLAELPHIYERVYEEQVEIAKTKASGELLNWNDVQKMKFSWNVACEVMRLAPPLQGAFREAINDFVFNGFSIPKGWKLYWSASSTHRSPKCFPEPEKFDPTRFEGNGPAPYTYVPFGGGPRMCPGKEYARLEILVFMHNLVKKFEFQKLIPDEKIVVNPMPIPQKGLPVLLRPHTY